MVGRHLLVKQIPYTGWILVRMSQEPDQHGQEEHYVNHENGDRVGEGIVSVCDDAGIHQGIECRFNLFNLCAHEYRASKMGSSVKLRTITKSLQAQIRKMR
jgi:hypothetical protein